MSQQLCNYEQSVALKAAGYDELCHQMYNEDKVLCGPTTGFNHNYFKYTCSAPSLHEAAQFLRERHRLHVVVGLQKDGWFYIIDELDQQRDVADLFGRTKFLDHDSALSAGISQALTIKQNK